MPEAPIRLRPEDAPSFLSAAPDRFVRRGARNFLLADWLRVNHLPTPTLWQLECERARRAKEKACPRERGQRPPTNTRHRGAMKGTR